MANVTIYAEHRDILDALIASGKYPPSLAGQKLVHLKTSEMHTFSPHQLRWH